MSFTDREFRDALGQFATGVCIITTEVDGILLGATVNSFNSVSLAPPLILFSLARSAQTLELWLKAKHFGVTVLAEGQTDLSNRFARGGADKWKGLAPLRGKSGVPLLRDGLVTLECEMYATHEGGDHEIILGKVLEFSRTSTTPLLFHGGRYQRLHSDQEIETPPNFDVWLHGW
jgi:flavin reductase (DIM6/NTAB) family NADH-FMN oxidoreductase RutF